MKEQIEINSSVGSTPAYLARPEKNGSCPGLILIHEVWGLKGHIKDVADRFAAQGYAVLAPDLIAHTGIVEKMDADLMKDIWIPEKRAAAQVKMRAAMAPIMAPEFGEQTVVRLKACFDYLKQAEFCNGKVGVLGFCFGGTYSYSLAIAEPQLNCAVVFYGHPPQDLAKLETITCPVLVFNGQKDENLIKQLPELKAAAEKYHKNFQFHEYPNAGHAFFNNTNTITYNKEAATDAWERSLGFLAGCLS